MYELQVNKYQTKVFLCDDGNWRHDTVFIYNHSKCIAEKEIETIIDHPLTDAHIEAIEKLVNRYVQITPPKLLRIINDENKLS